QFPSQVTITDSKCGEPTELEIVFHMMLGVRIPFTRLLCPGQLSVRSVLWRVLDIKRQVEFPRENSCHILEGIGRQIEPDDLDPMLKVVYQDLVHPGKKFHVQSSVSNRQKILDPI